MRVLGVNTGTSVDGVDLCLVDWNLHKLTDFKVIKSASYPFDPDIKLGIEKMIKMQQASFEEVSDLNFAYSIFIAGIINDFKNTSSPSPAIKRAEGLVDDDYELIELIGLHGQTIYHGDKSSWQIGDGSIIANLCGVHCVSDFRPADMALGGAGAPLTSYIDEKLIRGKFPETCIATLNIGGIANITVMQPERNTIAYDTGPGNTLIDTLMQKLFQKPYDDGGEIAFTGRANEAFIETLIKRTEYFSKEIPKTTGRELFNEKYAEKLLDLGNKENIISSASYLTVKTISDELNKYPIKKLFVAGGGRNNKYIINKLQEIHSGIEFLSHDELNINDQYKEAMLFSLLAFTSFNQIPNNVPGSTGASKATILGKLSYA